jgi:hypothetical protein
LCRENTLYEVTNSRDRILLVMATGTGKTYTTFQILWPLWKAGRKKRRDADFAQRPSSAGLFKD